MIVAWRDIAPRDFAKKVRVQSANFGGERVWVYLRDGRLEITHRFRISDDNVGCYTATSRDEIIIGDVTESIATELKGAR